MQAVILAAGMGTRLKPLTSNMPKCMVEVNGVSLICRALKQLETCGISKCLIVTGFESEKLIDCVSNLGLGFSIEYICNSDYNKTNNIYSLSLAERFMSEDETILLESDLIFDTEVLSELIADREKNIAVVDKYQSWMDGTCLNIDEDYRITGFLSSKTESAEQLSQSFKTVNIYKISAEFSKKYFFPFINTYMNAFGYNDYYEKVLDIITSIDNSLIKAKPVNGKKWYEIDNVEDLANASRIFK